MQESGAHLEQRVLQLNIAICDAPAVAVVDADDQLLVEPARDGLCRMEVWSRKAGRGISGC